MLNRSARSPPVTLSWSRPRCTCITRATTSRSGAVAGPRSTAWSTTSMACSCRIQNRRHDKASSGRYRDSGSCGRGAGPRAALDDQGQRRYCEAHPRSDESQTADAAGSEDRHDCEWQQQKQLDEVVLTEHLIAHRYALVASTESDGAHLGSNPDDRCNQQGSRCSLDRSTPCVHVSSIGGGTARGPSGGCPGGPSWWPPARAGGDEGAVTAPSTTAPAYTTDHNFEFRRRASAAR